MSPKGFSYRQQTLPLSYLEHLFIVHFSFKTFLSWHYLKSVKLVLLMCNFTFIRSGLSYHICFTFRMAQKISGLSDYKKQQNDLEILLCLARILQ